MEDIEKKFTEELSAEVPKQSGKKHIKMGQYGVITEFSKFWVEFEGCTLLDEGRTQVEQAILNWIRLRIEKRREVS